VTAVPLGRNRDFLLLQIGQLLSNAGSQLTVIAFSTLSMLAMRTRFQDEREPELASLRTRLAEGFRFLWRQPFLRTCAFLYGLTNFLGPGILLAVIVVGKRQGLSGGGIGLLVSAFGVCLLLGSLLSPIVRRVLPVRAVLLLELWTWLGCALFLAWPNVYVLTASILPTAVAIPSTDSVVTGYRMAMSPDRLLGRVESVRSTISLLVAPVGPLAAGVLLGAVSARATIAVFAAFALVLAVWGTLSPRSALRRASTSSAISPEAASFPPERAAAV
jgi:MFS transporter